MCLFKTSSALALAAWCAVANGLTADATATAPAPKSAAQAREILAQAKLPGGILVFLGCDDPDLLAALRADARFLVQAFDRDPQRLKTARDRLQQLGAYGGVSVLAWENALPYPPGTVNAVIAPSPSGWPLDEARRVLAPGGALCRLQNGRWSIERQPVPAGMDQWPQFLHDAQNNAVSHDAQAGPCRSLQWVSAPRWARDHGQLGWVMVTAGGKLLSLEDEGPIAHSESASTWKLICRDAFNGLTLWKRDVPVWFEHLYFRSGPNQLMRRLIAQDGQVFATLALTAPVSVLDPDSGQTLRTLADTSNTAEMVYDARTLFLLINPDLPKYLNQYYLPRTTGLRELPHTDTKILAVSSDTGQILWQKAGEATANVMELTLAADAKRVFFLSRKNLVCLDRATGKTLWQAPRAVVTNRPTWSAPTLIVHGPAVFVGDRDAAKKAPAATLANGGAPCTITAYSVDDGRALWECPAEDGFHFPVDVLAINGKIWSGATANKEKDGFTQIRDALTGQITFTRKPDAEYADFSAGHHRCHRNKATDHYLLTGRDGVQWTDVATGVMESAKFIRGNCAFGVMPANGLLYVPPNGCACNFYEKLPGLLALSPTALALPKNSALPKPLRGPAAAPTQNPAPQPDEWPAFRHDNQRSGAAPTTVPATLKLLWTRPVGGRLSALTSAHGRLFTASIDRHTLCALDAARGEPLWDFTAQSRIDSPPTLAAGKVYFGSCDGSVYALDAATGALLWKLPLAPAPRFIQSYGALESTWPVHGSVLLRDTSLYALAGRSEYLDGGLFLYQLNADTGDVLARRNILETPAGRSRQSDLFLPDILSADADSLYVRQARFDPLDLKNLPPKAHLWSGTGFLDDTLYNRAYWMYSDHLEMGNPHWFIVGNTTPAGKIMCFDQQSFYCFGPTIYGGHSATEAPHNHLYAAPRDYKLLPWDKKVKFAASAKQFVITQWSVPQDLDVLALVRTKDTLFAAGPLVDTPPAGANAPAKERIVLRALDPSTGKVLAEYPLPAWPVFDGLIASANRLYCALRDGTVQCYGAKP